MTEPEVVYVVQAFIRKRPGRGNVRPSRILMVRDKGRVENKLPGGGIEKNEGPEEALRRELSEELEGDVDFATYEMSYAGRGTFFKEGRGVTICYTRFTISIPHLATLRPAGEIEKVGWFPEEYAKKREFYFRFHPNKY